MATSLLVQTSFLGDVVLTTPLVAQLARSGPVDVVTTTGGAALLANNPDVRRIVAYDKHGRQSGLAGLWALAREVLAPSADAVAYLAQGSVRSAALAVAARYHERVGFETSAGRWLYTRRVGYAGALHHAERLWRLGAGPLTAAPDRETLRPRLYPGNADCSAVDDVLRGAGHAGEPLLALAPGSVWATKRWPYYAELARRLTTFGRVVVIGSRADRALATAIVDATSGAAIDATGGLSLLASAELIRRCALVVTNDSAPQHLASAMSTPTIAIFGPTVTRYGFGPLAPQSVVVEHDGLDCRPCHTHGPPACPLGHWRCMRELDVESVAALVEHRTMRR